MVAVELPPCDPDVVQRRLFDEHRIEVPCFDSAGGGRCSGSRCRATTTEGDIEKLIEAMRLAGIEPATSRSGGARSIP